MNLAEHLQHLSERLYPRSGHPRSQCGEEGPLKAILQPKAGPGVYVDVGANDAMECSNTWPFYQLGWRGLLIEPLPTCWSSLLAQRPGDLLSPFAAADAKGFAFLRERTTPGLSSLYQDWPVVHTNELLVEVNTLEAILDTVPNIRDECRLCSIDVEGYETKVVEGINFDTFRPDVFVVEYLTYAPGGHGEDVSGPWLPIFKAAGYEPIDRSELNMILLRQDLMPHWESVANGVRLCALGDMRKYQ